MAIFHVRDDDKPTGRRYRNIMRSASIAYPSHLKRAVDGARSVLRMALGLALPPLCAACREPVEGKGLCPACWSKVSFITRPYCERLGIPFVYDPGPDILSIEAIADPPAYHRARAAVRFDETSRALVHGLKYGDRLDLAPLISAEPPKPGANCSPTPTHWSRCRCTGAATGPAASTSRRSWRR